MSKIPESVQYAAVDLGSNSFHMVVAKVEGGQLKIIDRLREQVQLRMGMGDDKMISPDAWERGQNCLAMFGQRLRGIPAEHCRVVGTNTLRRAINGDAFASEASVLLGHDIEIISGREEARLIYQGVVRDASITDVSRLVIDIGGGSTEVIVGNGLEPSIAESIHVGCVSMSEKFFADGDISAKTMRKAQNAVLMELHPVLYEYRDANWEHVIGCSGTIKTISVILTEMGLSDGDGFSADALDQLCKYMVDKGNIDKFAFDYLAERRLRVICGGVAVLQALFNALGILRITVSQTALREGVLYDLYGAEHQDDVQRTTLRNLADQYKLDLKQASRVRKTVLMLLRNSTLSHPLQLGDAKQLLFATRMYELGWTIAHSQYHKHGHYLLLHSDLRGFSTNQQSLLADFVRYHRRKLPNPIDEVFTASQCKAILILRLSVIINRDRQDREPSPVQLEFSKGDVAIRADKAWLEASPLTESELQTECEEWARVGKLVELNP